MKKILFVALFTFAIPGFTMVQADVLTTSTDQVCKVGDLFSFVTGSPCKTATSTVQECKTGDLFSTVTGKPCAAATINTALVAQSVAPAEVTYTRTDYTVKTAPFDVTFDSSTNSIWTANWSSGDVTKLNASTGAVIGTYSVGNTGPRTLTFDPSTNSIWVVNDGSDLTNVGDKNITKLNAGTGAIVGRYTAGSSPLDIAFDSSTNSIWVLNLNSNDVTKINASTGVKVGAYPAGWSPRGVTFDSTDNSIWTSNSGYSKVRKLSAATGAFIGEYPAGTQPEHLTFDPFTNSIWVVNDSSTGTSTVTKINAANGDLIGTYAVGASPMDVTFDPSTNSVWAANYRSNNVTKLDASIGALLGTYAVSKDPRSITFDPSTNSIWTANFSSNKVTKLMSSITASTTPIIGVPSAPVLNSVTPGNGSATLIFTAPTNTGGSAITGYTATCGTRTATGASSPLIVTGLTNGASYSCSVSASNAIGASIASNLVSVTPAPPADNFITASPTSCTIPVGETWCPATLTWSTKNATTPGVYVSNSFQGNTSNPDLFVLAATNNIVYNVTPHAYTFTLKDGSKVLGSATVTGKCAAGSTWAQGPVMYYICKAASTSAVPAITSFTASPTSVVDGARTTLSWRTSNVTSCTAGGSWTGVKAASGTSSTGSLASGTSGRNYTFTLSCSGVAGTTPASASVTVTATVPTETSYNPDWSSGSGKWKGYEGAFETSPPPPTCNNQVHEGGACVQGSSCVVSGWASRFVCNASSAASTITYVFSKTTLTSISDSLTFSVSGLDYDHAQGCLTVLAHPIATVISPATACTVQSQFTYFKDNPRWKWNDATKVWTQIWSYDTVPSAFTSGVKIQTHFRNTITGEKVDGPIVSVSLPVAPAPTAHLTVNGLKNVTLYPGDKNEKSWSGTGSSYSSTYRFEQDQDSGGYVCQHAGSNGPWVASTASGPDTPSSVASADNVGCTAIITYIATNYDGVSVSDTIHVTTKASPGSCAPWGKYLPSGQSIPYYVSATAASLADCESTTNKKSFTCLNGSLQNYAQGMTASQTCSATVSLSSPRSQYASVVGSF